MVIRTQISLSSAQLAKARAVAAQRGVSLAALLRQALDLLLGEADAAAARERAKQAIGGFRSGRTDTSARHDDALAETDRW